MGILEEFTGTSDRKGSSSLRDVFSFDKRNLSNLSAVVHSEDWIFGASLWTIEAIEFIFQNDQGITHLHCGCRQRGLSRTLFTPVYLQRNSSFIRWVDVRD